MVMSWRYSVGAKLDGMRMAWSYDHDINQDHAAIRKAAGLMDVSGLKKLNVVGPQFHALLQYATTRDCVRHAFENERKDDGGGSPRPKIATQGTLIEVRGK
jgi:glycine cleavage system aminomethyltransferase T